MDTLQQVGRNLDTSETVPPASPTSALIDYWEMLIASYIFQHGPIPVIALSWPTTTNTNPGRGE